jgi:hypothetical protein
VREAIEHLLRTRDGVTKTWLVDKLVAIIDTDLADVSDWDADGELVFKTSSDLTAEQTVAVSEIAQERGRDGARTLKIRLYDKLAAMGHLAKLLNLLVDRQEISGPNGGPVEVTDHRVRIMDRLNAITGITKTWLVDKLEAIVDADLADVSEWDGDGKLVFKTSSELTAEQKVAVSQIAQERGRDGARTLKIRLYDKLAAMGHLAKLLNLLVNRQEIGGPNGGPVEVTDHRTRIMDRLNAIAKRPAPDNDGALEGNKRAPPRRGEFVGFQWS